MENNEEQIYYNLEIRASSATTEIWLGDHEGHFVQKEVGVLQSGLVPGDYIVEFGLGYACYPISLSNNSEYEQSEIEMGPSRARPSPVIPPDETKISGK